MNLLLDTHAFLWWTSDAPELSPKARKAIASIGSFCYVSMASCWEMAIKRSLGKLVLDCPVERFIPEHLDANGFRLLDIDFRHVAKVETLPFHHRDPFDRLLVAQASVEKLTVVSRDARFADYGIKCIW